MSDTINTNNTSRTNRQLLFDNIDRVDNLNFSSLEKKYLKVQYINMILIYLGLMIFFFISIYIVPEEFYYQTTITITVETLLLLAAIINALILPRAFASKGYAIREHDITYKSGYIFNSVITVPFRKIQQVSISQNPITRIIGLYAVEIVNGAQMHSSTSIPGLTKERANEIKALLIEMISNENK